MIDFDIPADTAALRDQIRGFVSDKTGYAPSWWSWPAPPVC
jgi:hypothetical protein